MSDKVDISDAVVEYSLLITSNYTGYAVLALLLYEYSITISAEVDLFWRRKWTGASVLFFLNRYVSLLYFLFDTTDTFGISQLATCRASMKMIVVLNLILYVIWAGFSGLRIYSLSRNRAISSFIFLLSMISVGVNATQLWLADGTVIPGIGCTQSDSISVRVAIAFTITSRSSLIMADTLLIAVTWFTLYRQRVSVLRTYSLSYIFVRDGTVYYLCLSILNILHVTFTLLSVATPAALNISDVTELTDPLTSVMIARFMLNLQEAHNRTLRLGSHADTQNSSFWRNSSIIFDRVMGSLGSSVIDDTRALGGEDDPNRATQP